jgi:predicted aldo/keto reductase-like oxidoreductase
MGTSEVEEVLRTDNVRASAMQVLAAGAIPPIEAIEYVCKLKGVHSILFGASSKEHIKQNKEIIDSITVK